MKLLIENGTPTIDFEGNTVLCNEDQTMITTGLDGRWNVRNGMFWGDRSRWHHVIPIREWKL
jgi:hypothetical protein